jgi:hypothetical protein
MTVQIIQERLDRYGCESRQDLENALREISQNIALLALFREAGRPGRPSHVEPGVLPGPGPEVDLNRRHS